MSEYNAQHFVPKFLLRRFASDEDRRRIDTYLIDRRRLVKGASIRKQPQRHKLYGSVEQEHRMTALESECSPSFGRVIANQVAPEPPSHDFVNLIVYTYLQSCRTPRAAQRHEQINQGLFEALLRQHPDPPFPPDEILEAVRIKVNNALAENMSLRLSRVQSILDLRCGLLFNDTSQAFVTSDNPAIFYNQFFEVRGVSGGGGAAVKGLELLLPIGPRHYLVFYDPEIYQFGSRVMRGVPVRATLSDVHGLNKLQMLSAQHQIFCDGSVSEQYLTGLGERMAHHPQRDLPLFRTVTLPGNRQNPDGTVSTFMMHVADAFEVGLRLSCLAETKHAKRYVIRPYRMHLRGMHDWLWKQQTGRSTTMRHPAGRALWNIDRAR